MSSIALSVAQDVRTQSLTAIVGGFSFASAIAWMDAVRWAISQVVKVNKNGGTYYVLTALFTTLLAVLAYTLINMAYPSVEKPKETVYAIASA